MNTPLIKRERKKKKRRRKKEEKKREKKTGGGGTTRTTNSKTKSDAQNRIIMCVWVAVVFNLFFYFLLLRVGLHL